MSDKVAQEKTPAALDTIGEQATTIPVELSTRFLEQFSEQLYSSPQKAFEELISNRASACIRTLHLPPAKALMVDLLHASIHRD